MDNTSHQDVLSKIKKRLRTDTFTREYILDIVKLYPDLIKLCHINFAMVHYINPDAHELRYFMARLIKCSPSLSYQRLQTVPVLSEQELLDKIKKTVQNNHEFMVSLLCFESRFLNRMCDSTSIF